MHRIMGRRTDNDDQPRYTASAQLVPRKQRAIVGWVVGWLNILGQIVGLSSTEFGLANMIWAAVVVGRVR